VLQGVSDWIWRKPGVFQLQRCETCGLVATRPRPTPGEGLGFYYAEAYSSGSKAESAREFYASGLGQLLCRYRLITIGKVREVTADDRLLDVGCSFGAFLEAAHRHAGCATFGSDIDADNLATALNREHTTYRVGALRDADWPAEDFTVITFYQCLEHDPDPVETLAQARGLLRPGGLCVVEVPDYRGLWRRVFGASWLPLLVPQHLSHFTPATLRATFEAAGLEVVHAQSMLFPGEAVASLAIGMMRVVGPSPEDGGPLERRMLDAVLGLVLVAFFLLVDLPMQFVLRIFHRAGHQVMIARRPLEGRQG